MTNGQTKKWPNIIGLVEMFARLFGRPKAQAKATSTTEPSSSTEKPPKHLLLDTLCKTRAERLLQQQCNSKGGEVKSRKRKPTSKASKPSGKGSKTSTSQRKVKK